MINPSIDGPEEEFIIPLAEGLDQYARPIKRHIEIVTVSLGDGTYCFQGSTFRQLRIMGRS